MALSGAAWGALRLKKLDSAGQKERNVSQAGLWGWYYLLGQQWVNPSQLLQFPYCLPVHFPSFFSFLFPSKRETGRECDFFLIERNVIVKQTTIRNRSWSIRLTRNQTQGDGDSWYYALLNLYTGRGEVLHHCGDLAKQQRHSHGQNTHVPSSVLNFHLLQ